MPKQLNVNLAFTADTKQAEAQIRQLQKSLDDLMIGSTKNSRLKDFSQGVLEAQQSALKLKTILNESLNVDTGRLDLAKFNQSLQDSGLTLSSLGARLSALGPEGKQAFLNLANSIVTAQQPMVETNKLLDGMWTALKNTARWQLSSSLLHGFIGAIQGAYGYAQDLNESLNNIRIVTGQSTEQMAAFAEQANKSAQALSVSTTAYTDAALIYYQQGLSDTEVKARTDITMMMSNVTGQSAEQVSSYMTAIWNNFAEGSENLEYFADVITALGAATASSSEEIANGLQQFAAVADTVGLSYEYAATALATVVAQTRQSESTVGNSFRTIFSRLQGLKLGETLEDGTTLNKYSEALATVGVNIKDQNGELKNMDTILNEIGAKWQTLTKDQQVALAQTVGGVRQYTNLIALFENWDKFQKNLQIAYGSEGSLEGQAAIYAEGWEAAQKRVKAAWQAIWQDLINDKFFITLLNGFEKVLKGVDGLIDALGGLPGVLAVIGATLTQVFGTKLEAGLKNAQLNINKLFFKDEIADYNADQAVKAAREQLSEKYEDQAQNAIIENQIYQIELNNELRKAKQQLSNEEQVRYSWLVQQTGEMAKQYSLAIETQQKASEQNLKVRKENLSSVYDAWVDNQSLDTSKWENILAQNIDSSDYKEFLEDIRNSEGGIESVIKKYSLLGKEFGLTSEKIRELIESEKALDEARTNALELGVRQETIEKAIQKSKEEHIPISQALLSTMTEEASILNSLIQEKQAEQLSDEISEEDKQALAEEIEGLTKKYNVLTGAIQKYNAEEIQKKYNPNEDKAPGLNLDMRGLTYGIRGITQFIAALTSLNKAFDVLEDQQMTWSEKLVKILPSVASGIISLSMALSSFEQFKKSAIFTQLGGAFKTLGTQFIQLFINPSLAGLKSLLLLLGKTLAPILAIIAAIWLVKKAWDAYQASTPEGKLKAANEALEKTTAELEKTKNAVEDLKNAFEELSSVRTAIENMEGSERSAAIAEENQKILDLIESTESWQAILDNGGLHYDESGLILLTQQQQQAIINDKQREESLLRQQAYEENINKIIAERNKEFKDEYDGKDIVIREKTGTTTVGGRGGSRTVETYKNNNVTQDVANLLNENGLSINQLKDADGTTIEKFRHAIDSSRFNQNTNQIMSALLGIAQNDKDRMAFEKEQSRTALYDQRINAFEEQNARETLGSELTDLSSIDAVQKQIIDAWYGLSDTAREQVLNGSKSLEEALIEAGFNLKRANEKAAAEKIEELQIRSKEGGSYLEGASAEQAAGRLSQSQIEVVLSMEGLPEGVNTWKDFENWLTEVGQKPHEIPLKISVDGLTQFKGDQDELNAEIEEFSEYLKRNYKDYQYLSDHIAECDDAADAAAASFIRFDDAMQDVAKNYKAWKKALDSKDVVQMKNAVKDLRKTYANLLDLDGSQLSEAFLKDSKNLELLNTVLNGTEEEAIAAYEELQKIQTIEFAKTISPEIDVSAFSEAYDEVAYWRDMMDLKMGDDIQAPDLYYDNLVAGLNGMLGSMAMTKEQADSLMRSMGYTGELQLREVNTTDTDSREDAIADVEPVDVPAQGVHLETTETDYTPTLGEMIHGTVPSVRWTNGSLTSTIKKAANTVTSFRWQVPEGGTLHYLGGAEPKVTNLPSRNYNNNGGNGGSGCFIAGTLITVNNHYENIENIKVGDIVLSYDEQKKKNVFNEVLQTMIHFVHEKIYTLYIEDETITATGIHKFLITRGNQVSWIQAADIQVGDLVLFANGTWHEISGIKTEIKILNVYNFEVSNTHNYYVGKNKILAHNKGSGSSKKAKKPKIEKPKEHVKSVKEADRYHNVKEKIEDLNTEMERLNKNKDRAFGKHRIDWMQKEIDKTQEQIDLTDEYIAEIKKYAKTDKEALKGKLKEVGIEGKAFNNLFDKNGVLKDYEGLLAKLQEDFDKTATAAYNKAIDEYNAAAAIWSGADQESDEAKDAWDEAKDKEAEAKDEYDKQKEKLEERIKALKQYEDTMNLLQEKQQDRIDQLNEVYDDWLKMTEYKVEISLDINESDRKLLDWIYSHLGDKADKAADRIANLGQQLKVSQKDVATYVKGIEELFKQNGMDVSLDAANLDGNILGQQLDEMIRKLRADGSEPNIQEALDDMKEYRDGLMNAYDTMRELVDEVTSNVVEAYEEWNEKLQENLDLMDHYDTVIDTIKEIADLLGEDQLGLGDAQAEAYEVSKLKNQQNAAAIAKDNYDAIAKERQKAQDALDQAESETEKRHWEEVLKNLQEAEKEAMEEYLARWRDALRQAEENYQASLERNEKVYKKAMSGGLGTLDRLQEQLDRQKELNNLYLDGYEKYKKLGDLTANINKNLANNPNVKVQEKMKDLLDDVNAKMEAGAEISEGEATVLEKRLALLEAENQLQEARNAKNAVRMIRDNEGNFSYTYTADISKIEEAQQNYADKFYDLLDYERQYAEETQDNMLKSWQDFIDKRNDILNDDMLSEEERNKALERLKGDYDELVSYYTDELSMVMDEMGRLKTEDWKDMEAILGRLLAAPEDFQTNYQDTVLGKITNAWQNPEDLKDSWVDAVNSLYDADTAARNKWVASNEETNRRVDTSTQAFADSYVGTLGDVVKASNDVAESAQKMAEDMGPAMDAVLDKAKEFFGDMGLYMDNLVGNIEKIVTAINDLQKVLTGVDPEWQEKILGELPEGSEQSNMAGYDTGGYTGEWGKAGKLAILHQKELVLNESDTSNILKAVDYIRNIPSMISGVNVNNTINYAPLAAAGATDLQQQVHIDASFPNVQSHTEIELALNNLINSASQYVNRKS